MKPSVWDPSGEAWTTTVECPAYGTIDVLIKTDGETSPPSEKQLKALALIATLPKSVRKTIRKDARRYANDYLGEEELEDFEGEDFDFECNLSLIPNLRDAEHTYFFMAGDSDIDIEHGVAFLCRDGDTFRVCHTDFMYENYPCDDTATLDGLLARG